MADEQNNSTELLKEINERIEARDREIEKLKDDFNFHKKLLKDTRIFIVAVLIAFFLLLIALAFDYIIYHTDADGHNRIEHCVHSSCR